MMGARDPHGSARQAGRSRAGQLILRKTDVKQFLINKNGLRSAEEW